MSDTKVGLKRDFIRVKKAGGHIYGGDQGLCKQKYMREVGCGVIGCANIVSYYNMRNSDNREIEVSDYHKLVDRLRRWYIPVIPGFGANGISLALGLNFFFIRNKMPLRCRWGCLGRNVYKYIGRMLANDCPVMISVGPNFPNLFGKKKVTLYRKINGEYKAAYDIKAHYMTVTAMDEMWLTVSSWGGEYYIKKADFDYYVRKHSNFIFSSILVINKK